MKILGYIEYFNPARQFGFVVDADKRAKRFFHLTHIASGTPATGRLCQYEAGQTSKGPVALDVEIFGGPTGPAIPSSIAGLDGGE